MSRYDLEPRDPRLEVSIGWDPCLANYFLQVLDPQVNEEDEDHDRFIMWLGADGYATETDVDGVLEEASNWAFLPPGMRVSLLDDKRREGTRPRPWFLFSTDDAGAV